MTTKAALPNREGRFRSYFFLFFLRFFLSFFLSFFFDKVSPPSLIESTTR